MARGLEDRFIEPVRTRYFIIRQDWIRDSNPSEWQNPSTMVNNFGYDKIQGNSVNCV